MLKTPRTHEKNYSILWQEPQTCAIIKKDAGSSLAELSTKRQIIESIHAIALTNPKIIT
jgi:hypothetical protein